MVTTYSTIRSDALLTAYRIQNGVRSTVQTYCRRVYHVANGSNGGAGLPSRKDSGDSMSVLAVILGQFPSCRHSGYRNLYFACRPEYAIGCRHFPTFPNEESCHFLPSFQSFLPCVVAVAWWGYFLKHTVRAWRAREGPSFVHSSHKRHPSLRGQIREIASLCHSDSEGSAHLCAARNRNTNN